ncbi:MAG TPA: NADH-quinone oxidoreductase subunit NuoE [Actinotalea caeni]|uniref:NADH-quinone oxidoreductase subunit NuoE n=1 Tax=Actinotalea caeni TaxID=1348467 RepID=UPI0012E28013|nr:NADH-quinone oxidoreductase subunit NuoE [Actinotalea caeni]HLV56948.1 NADH-quinone oxidoreductase subunit NuoE [Actinotalea caeni]
MSSPTTHRGFDGYPPEVRERLDADAQEILARYPEPRSALMPLLHLVQSEDGYVSPAGIAFCAEVLGISRANVSAVATFYSQYKRRPNGDYTVGVCTNTLCAVMGGDAIFERLSQRLGIHHDETTEGGEITLERIECNAACDYAPVMMVNWEFFDNQTPESALAVVDAILEGRDVTPTRGADKVVTFKEMSRVLAGFEDGRADEGGAGGDATMAGLRLAREKGWTAPPIDGSRLGGDAPEAAVEQAGTEPVGDVGSSAEHEPTTAADTDAEKTEAIDQPAPAQEPSDDATAAPSGAGEAPEQASEEDES